MTTNSRRTSHDYSETGREFLERARAYLADEYLLQASEKGWGAAAQMVKAAADARGWPHNHHGELHAVIRRLASETGDRSIRTAFNAAGALHSNFYEGWLNHEDIEENLGDVAELVEKLDRLNGAS